MKKDKPSRTDQLDRQEAAIFRMKDEISTLKTRINRLEQKLAKARGHHYEK